MAARGTSAGLLIVGALALVGLGACGETTNSASLLAGATGSGGEDAGEPMLESDGDARTADTGKADAPSTSDAGTDAADTDAADTSDASADASDDAAWPDCATAPSGVPTKTISEIWQANAATPTRVWLEGVHVTGISRGGCGAGKACQLYVQSKPSYPSLAAGARNAIKVFVSGSTADRFATIAIGDRVDVLGWGWRYDIDEQDEILVQVNSSLPGCMKVVGEADVEPVPVALAHLTRAAYEVTGPLLVTISGVSGKPPSSPAQTFGLYDASSFSDGGGDIVSLSPFFLPGASFSSIGLVPSAVNEFKSITGVFGMFVPQSGEKYLELYPRTATDVSME